MDELFSKLWIQEIVDNEVVGGAREEEAPGEQTEGGQELEPGGDREEVEHEYRRERDEEAEQYQTGLKEPPSLLLQSPLQLISSADHLSF